MRRRGPRRNPEEIKKFSVVLPFDVYDRLCEIAEKDRRPVSQLASVLIERKVNELLPEEPE